MRFYLLILCILKFSTNFHAIDFKIGLLRNLTLKSVSVSVSKGSYLLKEGMNDLRFIDKDKGFKVSIIKNKLKLSINGKVAGLYDTIKLFKNSVDTSFFSITGISPGFDKRSYFDNLIIFANNQAITLVNLVDFENYIIGVLESEVGLNRSKDFYKVHAVISRTYALKNQFKFIHEGFQLTDLVNCQVYKGKMYNDKNIIRAVNETKNLILVDENMDYITAAYFSNSGGQTNNVEDVWIKALPYLRSIYDPYSSEGYNYKWEKIINKESWLKYLHNKYNFPLNDSQAVYSACNFKQEIRHKFLIGWVYQIPLTEIRNDWNLKSTFFSITEDKHDLIFQGKGFGHGVGLSQEGAMKMIDLGYGFLDVLRFYYTDVHLIDMRMRDFYIID